MYRVFFSIAKERKASNYHCKGSGCGVMAVELHCLLSAVYHDTFWPCFFYPSCSQTGLSPEVKGQPNDLDGQIICLSLIQSFGLVYFFCAFALSQIILCL